MRTYKKDIVFTGFRYLEPDIRKEASIKFHRKDMVKGDMFKFEGGYWIVIEIEPEIVVKLA